MTIALAAALGYALYRIGRWQGFREGKADAIRYMLSEERTQRAALSAAFTAHTRASERSELVEDT